MKDANAKYGKMAEETTRVKENLRSRITSLESSPEVERDCTAHLKSDPVAEDAVDNNLLVDRLEAYDTGRCQLREWDKASRKAPVKWTAAISKLES